MPLSIISTDKFNTINWSGGTSTELYIYPESADYGLRNFDFRLSTAKVEVEKSDFTSLPGVSRKIMILDGQIEISHKNRYNKKLKEFDVDKFEGGWQTSSVGICTDFNLMTHGKTISELSSLVLLKKQKMDSTVIDKFSMIFIYLYSGQLGIITEQKEFILNQGELLILNNPINDKLKLIASKDSRLIISKILL